MTGILRDVPVFSVITSRNLLSNSSSGLAGRKKNANSVFSQFQDCPDSSTLNNRGSTCQLNQTFVFFTFIRLNSYLSSKNIVTFSNEYFVKNFCVQ